MNEAEKKRRAYKGRHGLAIKKNKSTWEQVIETET